MVSKVKLLRVNQFCFHWKAAWIALKHWSHLQFPHRFSSPWHRTYKASRSLWVLSQPHGENRQSPLGLLHVCAQPHLCDTWLCPAQESAQRAGKSAELAYLCGGGNAARELWPASLQCTGVQHPNRSSIVLCQVPRRQRRLCPIRWK